MTEKQKVVVVEDDPMISNLVKLKMEKSGYEVVVGENGRLGLELIGQHLPDLVILDVMMPIMDGFEVLRRIRADERTRDIPVIMLTARGMEDDILKGFESGAVDYLTKPFSISELAARAGRILAARGEKRES